MKLELNSSISMGSSPKCMSPPPLPHKTYGKVPGESLLYSKSSKELAFTRNVSQVSTPESIDKASFFINYALLISLQVAEYSVLFYLNLR